MCYNARVVCFLRGDKMVVFGRNVSKVRANYWLRMFFRIAVFITGILLYIFHPQSFKVLEGMNFFKEFSVFHILWALWMYDMFLQIFPIKSNNSLGSKKLFKFVFKPGGEKIGKEALKAYTRKAGKKALLPAAVWIVFTATLCFVYLCDFGFLSFFGKKEMFLVTTLFYVFDLICVLIWCPFRLMQGNRCCTDCRIFNWDHFMLFSPILLIGGFYAISLVVMALICLAVWELNVFLHPERFWEGTNDALKCENCTDKLCAHAFERHTNVPEKEKEPALTK